MLKPGLVSVSFRTLSCEEIIRIAASAGLEGIEWGGDVHVPPDNIENALIVAEMTHKAGLLVAAYGSYYRLGSYGTDYKNEFKKVLSTACALGAPTIRIWAGTSASASVAENERERLVQEAKKLAEMAKEKDITIAFECHRNTLTDCRASALRLMHETGMPNLRMYWQPNECYDFAENSLALADLLPYAVNIHVFNWPEPGLRLPLSDGFDEWSAYFDTLKKDNVDRWCMLEFMPDDNPASLPREALTLKELLGMR